MLLVTSTVGSPESIIFTILKTSATGSLSEEPTAVLGVLILNLGTPDSPSVKDVRVYLREFLNDPRVIDIGKLARLLLVNLIIVPFHCKQP